MKAGKAPFSQQLDEAIYRKPGGMGKKQPFMRLQVHVKEGMRAVWGSAPAPSVPAPWAKAGQPASRLPQTPAPAANGAGKTSLNHREG